ncbi:hypothetical protein AB1Y20_010766 [Prymnesium parvum]|uniref:Dolichyl-diphosphooligosaccharide--protein glycosyltransferase subunit KCP2 n=1 Tax=Prymnesium parvum TaxID=97485 RepID=A0AB34IQN0_PRYPA
MLLHAALPPLPHGPLLATPPPFSLPHPAYTTPPPVPTLRAARAPHAPPRSRGAAMRERRPPALELTALLAADVAIIFVFAIARTLAQLLASPDFAGWLAPVEVDAPRLAATLGFAGACGAVWAGAGLATGAYTVGANRDARRATRTAVRSAAAFLGICLLTGAAGGAPFAPLSIDRVGALLGLAAALVAWRWSYGDMM